MSWALLDDDFPNHPKVVEAGPVASFLFVCGLCYCRKYHTDGFIPMHAVKNLGVTTNPKRLVETLIAVKLWDLASNGYQVHDYRKLYDDTEVKEQREERRQKKREAGRKGGQASWLKRSGQVASSTSEAETKQPAEALAEAHRVGVGSSSVLSSEKKKEIAPETPFAVWLSELQQRYPKNRVTSGYKTETAFFAAIRGDGRPFADVWADMQAGLESQMAGYQWRSGKYIPKLDRWLESGDWKQRHEVNEPEAEAKGKIDVRPDWLKRADEARARMKAGAA